MATENRLALHISGPSQIQHHKLHIEIKNNNSYKIKDHHNHLRVTPVYWSTNFVDLCFKYIHRKTKDQSAHPSISSSVQTYRPSYPKRALSRGLHSNWQRKASSDDREATWDCPEWLFFTSKMSYFFGFQFLSRSRLFSPACWSWKNIRDIRIENKISVISSSVSLIRSTSLFFVHIIDPHRHRCTEALSHFSIISRFSVWQKRQKGRDENTVSSTNWSTQTFCAFPSASFSTESNRVQKGIRWTMNLPSKITN